MKIGFSCATLSVGLLVCSCQTERTRIEQTRETIQGVEYVTIAVVGTTDSEAQAIIQESLKENGVPCVMYGTIAYGVEVPYAQYQQALKKLKHEPKLKGKWIRFT